MKNICLFAVIISNIGFSTTTFYSHRHVRYDRRDFHFHMVPTRFYVRRLPPTFIKTHIIVPYGQPGHTVPLSVFPVGTRYPATGLGFPNPLDDRNTYDNPPSIPSFPVDNNAGPAPGSNASPLVPPSSVFNNAFPLPDDTHSPWKPTAPVFNNAKPLTNDAVSPWTPSAPVFNDNTVSPWTPSAPVFNDNTVSPWTPSVPVFNNVGPIPDDTVSQWSPSAPVFNNAAPILPTGEITVVDSQPQPVPEDADSISNNDNDHIEMDSPPPPFPVIPDPESNDKDDKPLIPTLPPEVTEKTCVENGCGIGSECVYQSSFICPSDMTELPCQCQRGCRMQYTFVPLGSSTIVDPCGNTCTCNSLLGGMSCTQIPCNNNQPSNSSSTTGLILEPATSDNKDFGPSRGDFPFSVLDGHDPSKSDVTFPKQNFVPPIPFLTDNNIGLFPGLGVNSEATVGKNVPIKTRQGTKSVENNSNIITDAMVFPVNG